MSQLAATRTAAALASAAAILLVTSLAGHDVNAAEQESLADIYRAARQASAEVIIADRHRGSAWFVDSSGLLFTAAHVMGKGEGRIEVFTTRHGRLPVEIIAIDKGHDIALLRVKGATEKFTAVPLAESLPRVGDDVYLFGSPLFRRNILLSGRVAKSDLGYEFYLDQQGYVACYYVAAATAQGSSGGAWLNDRGEAVGLQSGAMSLGQSLQGLAFVSPLAAMKRLLQMKVAPRTPTLGVAVEETWQQSPKYLAQLPQQTNGLVVKELIEKSAADHAGIKRMEVITALDGKPVRLASEFLHQVRQGRPDDILRLRVLTPETHVQREVAVKLFSLN